MKGTDTGPILLQKAVETQPDDTPETFAAPGDGAGRMEDSAGSDRSDRQWKSNGQKTEEL